MDTQKPFESMTDDELAVACEVVLDRAYSKIKGILSYFKLSRELSLNQRATIVGYLVEISNG